MPLVWYQVCARSSELVFGLFCRTIWLTQGSYYQAVQTCVLLGDAKMALLWAKKGADDVLHLLGNTQSYHDNDLCVVKQLQAAVDEEKSIGYQDMQWPDGWGKAFPN
jgi:hypothetical protein